MKAHEFWARTDSQGQLILPVQAQEQLPKNQLVRVLVLVDEGEPADSSQEQQPTASSDEEHLGYGDTVPYDGI